MRISKDGNGVAGSKEEIESDILVPDTRIPSTPEVGSESNAGDINTEWNADEQDEWFAGLFSNNWEELSATRKKLVLGNITKSFSFFEKFPQTPVAWQHYKNEYVNQLTMDFATDSFVKLTWNFMGANAPDMKDSFPLSITPTFLDPLTTKSFITKKDMWLKIGDTVAGLSAFRQSPSMNITINNNLEKTPALGEDESIENSLGDFVIEGTLESYNVDDTGKNLFNDANQGKDKVIQIAVSRKVYTTTTRYTLTLPVHLGAPTKSRNGNKYQFSVPFKVNKETNLELVKDVITNETHTAPETPVFENTLADVPYKQNAEATALDGTATVTDGGTVTYSWKKDGVQVATTATVTPSTENIGEFFYSVTATNTKNGETAVATQRVKVTVTASE